MQHFEHTEIDRQAQYRPFSKYIHTPTLERETKELRAELKTRFDADKLKEQQGSKTKNKRR